MKKNKFEDIIPSEKRSIRNIPLPGREESPERVHLRHVSMDGIQAPRSSTGPVKKTRKTPSKIKISSNSASESQKEDTSSSKLYDSLDDSSVSDTVISRTTRGNGTSHYKAPQDAPVSIEDESYEVWSKNGKKRSWYTWVLAIIVIVIFGYYLTDYFSSAHILIKQTKMNVAFSGDTLSLNNVQYDVASVDIEKSVTVQASGVQKITRNATGQVYIYNGYNTASQKLIQNTRLSTSDGHIFRIDSTVTVPGMTTVNGKKIAGSVLANVTAEKPGAEYNLGLKDFTIPGFQGTDKYSTFYARSKTALAGGLVGTVPNVDQKSLQNNIATLKKSIRQEADSALSVKAKERGSGYAYVPSANVIVYQPEVTTLAKDGTSATITQKATVTGIILDNLSFSNLLIQSERNPQDLSTSTSAGDATDPNSDYKAPTYTGDFSKLELTISGNPSPSALLLSMTASSSISVAASGTVSIVTNVNAQRIASAVSGLSREQAVSIIKSLIKVDGLEVNVNPWWTSKLPSASKISVETEE